MAELADQLGKMVEHPKQSQPNRGSPRDGSPCSGWMSSQQLHFVVKNLIDALLLTMRLLFETKGYR